MLRIAICDDKASEREIVRQLVEDYSRSRELVVQITEFSCGEELVLAYEEENTPPFDLILLDVLMDKMNGMAAAHWVRRYDSRVALIFLTVSRDYAVESYEVDADGYLVKPIDSAKLYHLMDRVLKKPDSPRMAVQTQGRMRYLYYSELMCVESRNHATFLTLDTGEVLRSTESLTSLDKRLSVDPRFFRCHKSYLVNMDFIERVEDTFFILIDGMRVPYRVREKKLVTDHYYHYFLKRNLR